MEGEQEVRGHLFEDMNSGNLMLVIPTDPHPSLTFSRRKLARSRSKSSKGSGYSSDYRTVQPSCPQARFIPYVQESPDETYPINRLR